MNDYERWQQLQQALQLAINCIREKRQTLGWQDDQEELIEQYDSAIRELQSFIETSM